MRVAADRLDVALGQLLEEIGGPPPGPGGGTAAAATVALAAQLVAMTARAAGEHWPEGRAAAAQAVALSGRASRAAHDEAVVFPAALAALREPGRRDGERGDALDTAAAVPLQLAETAADVADLAALAAGAAHPDLHADVVLAAMLAEAGARAAAHLVEVNLTVAEGDQRLAAARAAVAAAGAALERARGVA